MGSVRKEGFPKPHPYTVVEGTFVYDGPPTESDLSFLPSGRLPVSATGFVKERFQLQNGAVRLRYE